jgi:AcrR family transcriptional regulator
VSTKANRDLSEPGTKSDRLLDQNGRPLGRRAVDTRRRLLDATEALLGERSLRELRVIDIARRVETSPATFYQYFKDVKDVVLCLAQEATDEMPAVVDLICGSWEGDAGLDRARQIVTAFIRYWDAHFSILRVRNQSSDEGDPAFARVRSQAMTPVLEALASTIEAHQRGGMVHDDVSPHAAAAAMAAILERLAAYHRELELVGVTREDLVATSARILYATITGQR